jgi:hypothetical protein
MRLFNRLKIIGISLLFILSLCNPCLGAVDLPDATDAAEDIDLSNPASLNLSTPNKFTLSAWIYFEGDGTYECGIISETFESDVQYELGLDADQSSANGQSRLMVGFYSGGWKLIREAASIATSTWLHVAGTWDGTTLRLYKSGSETVNGTPGGSLPGGAFNAVRIGIRHDNTGSFCFKGKITEVAIWDINLSATQVALLANARIKGLPLQIQSANLKGYYPLDLLPLQTGISGDTFKDLSGNGNDGTGGDGDADTAVVGEEVLSYPMTPQ